MEKILLVRISDKKEKLISFNNTNIEIEKVINEDEEIEYHFHFEKMGKITEDGWIIKRSVLPQKIREEFMIDLMSSFITEYFQKSDFLSQKIFIEYFNKYIKKLYER